MTNQIEELKKDGFKGFKRVKELRISIEDIPYKKGVYVVIRYNRDKPEFEEKGTGGHFKGKDPNKPIEDLIKKWVEGSFIIYIGQTERTLNERIEELLKFGNGQRVAHWGGRLIWQLKDREDLIIAWKELPEGDPAKKEHEMLKSFKERYKKLPFANLRS